MNSKRRQFVGGVTAAGVLGLTVGSGLLAPRSAQAAARPKNLFESDSFDDVVNQLGGGMAESADIKIKTPDIAENGAVVPVSVKTTLSDVESISILVEKNPNPLAAAFSLSSTAGGSVSTRIKMGKTSDVYAVVKSGGKLYSAKKEVKVTIGGCGG